MWTALAVCVLCACAPTQALELESSSLPEPYGHTAQISPHLPNHDREWYTEYRWKKGQGYKPQDGVITTQPQHAPIPKPPVEEKRTEKSNGMLNKKPVHVKDDYSEKGAKNNTSVKTKKIKKDIDPVASDPKIKTKTTESEKVADAWPDEKPKKDAPKKKPEEEEKKAKAPPKKKKPKKVWKDERYALPKPCGHTSNVHPTNANRDREWYTEYRWEPGTEYKPQDGAITEIPKPALRGITASPVTGDPCVQIK